MDTNRPYSINIFLLVVLSIVTLGFYIPIWFIIQRKYLNHLHINFTKYRIGLVGPILLIVLNVLGLLGEIIFPIRTSDQNGFIFAFSVGTIILSFKVKRIWETHHLQPISGVGVFFLTIFYLQYKFNQHVSSFGPTIRNSEENINVTSTVQTTSPISDEVFLININKIEKLAELKEKGILTDEEFQVQKTKILLN